MTLRKKEGRRLPPRESARRYVEYMGGSGAVLAKARDAFRAGDYRWVAEVVNHVVFAEPYNLAARELQADALEQMGYQAESGIWLDESTGRLVGDLTNGSREYGVRRLGEA